MSIELTKSERDGLTAPLETGMLRRELSPLQGDILVKRVEAILAARYKEIPPERDDD